jgi:hypothetical protein
MIDHATELSEIGQDFIDAIAENNGRHSLRPKPSTGAAKPYAPLEEGDLHELWELVKYLDPDAGYDDWLKVGMAIFYTTHGDDDGLALFDQWSAQGGKYTGPAEIERKWLSFDPDHENPVRIGTLIWMIQNGVGVFDD